MAKIHYLYKIENKLNKKIYIGIHSTENMNDEYMGSSVLVSQAIEKRKETYIKNKHQQGENNSRYGKRAVHNDMTWKWVQKEEVEKYLDAGWKLGMLKPIKEV